MVVRFRFAFAGWVLVASFAYAFGCGEGRPSGTPQSFEDGGNAATSPAPGVGGNDAAVATAAIRLAHVAPDLGAIDFCYRAAKTSTYVGPVLGGAASAAPDADVDGSDATVDGGDAGPGDADAMDAADADDADAADGSTTSLSFRAVSKYLALKAAGPLEIAIVTSGASCATPLFVQDVTVDPGKLATLAILGRRGADAGSPTSLGVVAFTDDRVTLPKQARVRLVHAALGNDGLAPTLSVKAVASKASTLAGKLEPRKASSPSSSGDVDLLGYATVDPSPPPAALSIVETSDGGDGGSEPWVSAPFDLGLRGDSLHTGFVLVGEGARFEVLWCTDTRTSTTGTACDRLR